MNKKGLEKGTSVFSRNAKLIDSDPLEEIFALNLGDFLTEHLISEDLAKKIGNKSVDKIDSLKKQLSELISIYSIDNTLSVLGFDNKEDYIIYNSIAKTVVQMVEVDACHIFLSKDNAKGLGDADKDLLLVGSSVDFKDDIYSHKIGYELNDKSFVSDAFKSKRSVTVLRCQNFEQFKPFSQLNEEKAYYYLAIPMHNNSEAVGVIVVQNYKNKIVSSDYIKLIDITSRLFTTSMLLQKLIDETSKLLDAKFCATSELQHLRAELTAVIGDLGEQQQLFVESLAKAVDQKGNYQNNHSQKVADLAKELCTYIGLNEKTKDLIYYAGLLQNIGKITLPEELFNKKEKLSKQDWEKLQNHPNVGVNLLMHINFMSEVIPYIHYHKERWDGKGEPEGLKGNSIPFGSRIIAVADAYCAMVAERVYRKAMKPNEAIEIIRKESQIKWDPTVVDALVSLKAEAPNE